VNFLNSDLHIMLYMKIACSTLPQFLKNMQANVLINIYWNFYAGKTCIHCKNVFPFLSAVGYTFGIVFTGKSRSSFRTWFSSQNATL